MKSVRNICKIIGNILFVIVLILLILVAAISLLARANSSSRMLIGGYTFGRVVSGSMEPDIPTGSFILIQQVDAAQLAVGDTIAFFSDDPSVPQGVPVSHRIEEIKMDENGARCFVTKGVANAEQDRYPARATQVVGKVVWTSVALGTVIALSQNFYVYPVLLLLLGILFVVNLVTVVQEARALKQQENDKPPS